MTDWIDQFVFYDDLSEEARSELDEALEGRAELAQAFAEWQNLRANVGAEFETLIQNRQLLVRYALWRSGRASILTPEELAEVESSRSYFDVALRDSPALKTLVDQIGREQADFEETWQLYINPDQEESAAVEHSDRWHPIRSTASQYFRVAAVLAIVAAVALLYAGLSKEQSTAVVTAERAVENVVLDDGSVVRLIKGSQLRYQRPEEGESFSRQVSLSGRALFTVVPSDDVFIVETPAAITTVWGTTFGLDSDDSFTEVVLAEGKVSVVSRRDTQRPVVLEPGEMTRVVGARDPTTPVKVNVADALSWTRLFVFRNDLIEQIAERLGEHYGVTIAVDPTLQHETMTGSFEHDWSLHYILQTVARALGAEVTGSDFEGYDLHPARPLLGRVSP